MSCIYHTKICSSFGCVSTFLADYKLGSDITDQTHPYSGDSTASTAWEMTCSWQDFTWKFAIWCFTSSVDNCYYWWKSRRKGGGIFLYSSSSHTFNTRTLACLPMLKRQHSFGQYGLLIITRCRIQDMPVLTRPHRGVDLEASRFTQKQGQKGWKENKLNTRLIGVINTLNGVSASKIICSTWSTEATVCVRVLVGVSECISVCVRWRKRKRKANCVFRKKKNSIRSVFSLQGWSLKKGAASEQDCTPRDHTLRTSCTVCVICGISTVVESCA